MKHFEYTNCKHVSGFECSCCEETEEIIMDEIHAEIVCLTCGLVLFDEVNVKLTDYKVFVKIKVQKKN